MDEIDIMIRGMLKGCKSCPDCGCELIINKTFFEECFNCGTELWRPILKQENREVKYNGNEGNRVEALPGEIMVGAHSQLSGGPACWRK